MASHRSKYLGWMLFDKVASVRLAALEALIELCNVLKSSSGLESFVARFAPRVKGCLFDPESNVIVAALRLSNVWLAANLISMDEDAEHVEECERCLFMDIQEVREEVGCFFFYYQYIYTTKILETLTNFVAFKFSGRALYHCGPPGGIERKRACCSSASWSVRHGRKAHWRCGLQRHGGQCDEVVLECRSPSHVRR